MNMNEYDMVADLAEERGFGEVAEVLRAIARSPDISTSQLIDHIRFIDAIQFIGDGGRRLRVPWRGPAYVQFEVKD